MSEPVLQLSNIRKRFGSNQVLGGIDFPSTSTNASS
jgi:ABC-type sugar transport system ATPase subunit